MDLLLLSINLKLVPKELQVCKMSFNKRLISIHNEQPKMLLILIQVKASLN